MQPAHLDASAQIRYELFWAVVLAIAAQSSLTLGLLSRKRIEKKPMTA